MKRGSRRLLALIALFAIAAPEVARAIQVTVTPTLANLPVGRTTPTYTIRWQMDSLDGSLPYGSPGGAFETIPGAVPLGTTTQTYLLNGPTGPGTLVIATEMVRIPPDVVQRARQLGATGIRYTRLWADTAPSFNFYSVDFNLTGDLAGPFQILRFELRFDDGSPVRTVARGATLHAEAITSYSGTGDIQAVWEVADAASTSGAPIFRPLGNVVRHVSASGRVTLKSPELPTNASGLHLVRLRVTEPDTAFPLPAIRYSVLEEGAPGPVRGPSLRLRTPDDAATLGPDTRFAWAAVEGASAYQLEIYAEADTEGVTQPDQLLQPPAPVVAIAGQALSGRLVTGVAVRADAREATLSPVQRARLEPGRRYRWRVRAVDADGIVLGESAVREFRVPGVP